MLVSLRGSSVDLMHVLFGTVLALNDDALLMIGAVATVSLVGLALIWRPLVAECLDPSFLRSVSKAGQPVHLVFLGLVVLNLVGGFQALGTLMAVGLMMLPAAAARFWVRSLEAITGLAIVFGVISAYAGLLISYRVNVASGPAIILVAGAFYLVSLALGSRGLVFSRVTPARHRVA
jgi:zinc/manganese transport system permease protein